MCLSLIIWWRSWRTLILLHLVGLQTSHRQSGQNLISWHSQKSDMLLNNLCESFNSLILNARNKPILTMLEKIMTIMMKRIHVNKAKMLKVEGLLCPKIQQIFEKTKGRASYCVPNWWGDSKFEVDGPSGKFLCDLNELTCYCRMWDLTGIPCKHGVSALSYCGLELETFVHRCYYRGNYLQCYSNFIQPLNGPQMWPNTSMPPVLPPVYAVHPGQKQRKRRLEADEKEKMKKGKGKGKREAARSRSRSWTNQAW